MLKTDMSVLCEGGHRTYRRHCTESPVSEMILYGCQSQTRCEAGAESHGSLVEGDGQVAIRKEVDLFP